MKRLLAAALLALSAPALIAPFAATAAPAKRDWTRTVAATPQGTYVVGNPAAKVKLVEYLSFTCSHCAHFATEGMPVLLRNYVASGRVSFEIRNAVRDRFDLVAALLSRCQGGKAVVGATEALMAAQEDWIQRAAAYEQAQQDKLRGMAMGDAFVLLAEGSGLQALMGKRGLAPAAARVCLKDQAAIDRLAAIANEAWRERKIQGTPSFLVNGTLVPGAAGWAEVEPAIVRALK